MSSWVSCQKIVFNLHKAYQQNKDFELLNFNYSEDQTTDEVVRVAMDIAEAKPDVLLILDHKPHPYTLMKLVLASLEKINHKVKIVYHVFGDFTLFYQAWEELSRLMRDYEVEFVVASHRQKHLIDKFLIKPSSSHVCPFPVDRHEFSFNPAQRTLQRKEWGVTDQDMVFVFTGRLSNQKRIHTLIDCFGKFLNSTQTKNAHLYFYGDPDYIGDPFYGIWEAPGEYFRRINRVYRSLPLEQQKFIHFMGSVPNKELKTVYQGADMLLNLSVHNDEDFGMSVAEALCSGLPAILTDWGGLASFELKKAKDATQFIPVSITEKEKKVDEVVFMEVLKSSFERGHWTNRERISQEALASFSVETCGKIVKKIIHAKTPPFTEFSDFFDRVHHRYMTTGTPYIHDDRTINSLYREIYSSYVRNH